MRLIELQINAFGQFKNRRFSFEPGLSIIYGENEQGKSTLLACLKAMFFGFTGRGRSVRDNERLRYQPWNGSRLAANLVFEHAGTRYRLERTFGKTKAADKCVLMNDITGQSIDLPSQQEVGPTLFLVTAEEFSNTVFIGQLQSPIDSPDHSTLGKLANLSGSLDEGLSHQALDNQLLKAQVKLKADRGPGGLIPDLQRQIEQYEQLRQTAIDNESKQQDRICRLDELQNQIAAGESALKAAKARLAHIRLNEKTELLERLRKRHQDLEQLETTFQNLQKPLRFAGRIIDQEDIERFRSRYNEARSIQADLDNQIRIVKEQLAEQNREEAAVRGFDQLKEIDRPMLDQISNRIEAIRIESDRLKQAQQLSDLSARIRQSRLILDERELALKAIEQEIKAHSRFENTLGNVQASRSAAVFRLMIILSIILIVGGLVSGLLVRSIFFALSALGLIVLTAAWFTAVRNRTRQETTVRLAEEARLAEIQVLNTRLGLAREQAMAARLTLDQDTRQYNLLRSTVSPETLSLDFSASDLENLQVETDRLKSRLEDILISTGSTNLLELHIHLNEAEHARQSLAKRRALLSKEQAVERDLAGKAQSIWQELARSLQSDLETTLETGESDPELNKPVEDSQAIELKIDRLSRQVIEMAGQKRQLQHQLASFNETIRGQDWDYYLNTAEAELNSMALIGSSGLDSRHDLISHVPDFSGPPDSSDLGESRIDPVKDIDQINQQIGNWKLEATGIESAIRHSARTPLMAIEYEDLILQVREKMQDAQAYYDSLVLAREMFQAAYDEMQATFGPVLNEKTAETLRQLTGSRYQNIKIDRSFDVRVETPEDGSFHEWDYFSGGTIDQIYLALRLAISELIQASEDHLPLLLDDIFVQYDDERAAAGLKFLQAKVEAEDIQALLLTSHSRMKDMARAINLDAGTATSAIKIQSL